MDKSRGSQLATRSTFKKGLEVTVADVVKARMERSPDTVAGEVLDVWSKLFEAIHAV